jgi:hypothetical protein
MRDVVAEVRALGQGWHGAGTVTDAVISALDEHLAAYGPVEHTAETGTGRTTLIFSQRSADHLVFTKDDAGDGDSLQRVRQSPLLDPSTVSFVLGPTQRTLLSHEFTARLDVAYLDGPHAYPFPELEYWALYPHLKTGALLVIDDVQLPSIANMYATLKADRMYEALGVVDSTAFLRRTDAPALDPYGEGWWEQGYNARPRLRHLPPKQRALALAAQIAPQGLRDAVRKRIG